MIEKLDAKEYKELLACSDSIKTCPKVPLPQIEENQNFIFISYSHKDYKEVYADLADMYEAGVRFWYDKGLSAGKKWNTEVQEKLLNANCVGVIFFMSKNLFLSQSAIHEIELVCSLSSDKEDNSNNKINYFSVNLSDKLPIQILSETMQDSLANTLDMNMVSVLCKAFPDNATYLSYGAADHTEELILQIQNQFGVISDDCGNNLTISKDKAPCSVFIGTLFETLTTLGRKELVNGLFRALEDSGITAYVMQEHGNGYMNEDVDKALKDYVEQQNILKLESAQYLIVVCNPLGWTICAKEFGEFDPDVIKRKKVFYLVINSNYGDSEEFFSEHHKWLLTDSKYKDLLSRVFYGKDSEQEIINAIIKNKSE